jgi:GAF domain-containing protein
MNKVLPVSIAQAFAIAQTPEALFTALMPALGEALECDRCFLYLRDPQTQMGRVPFCWGRDASVPIIQTGKQRINLYSAKIPCLPLRLEPVLLLQLMI